jgi:hypothetical protein
LQPEKAANPKTKFRTWSAEKKGLSLFRGSPPLDSKGIKKVRFNLPDEADERNTDICPLPVPEKERRKFAAGRFYQSAIGLSKKEIPPLFLEPVEIVANCRHLKWVSGSIVPEGLLSQIEQSPYEGLPKFPQLAVLAEDTIRAFTGLEEDSRSRSIYMKRLSLLRFMRATWDALMLGYQAVRHRCLARRHPFLLRSSDRRAIDRFKVRIVLNPEQAALELKQLATEARGWYFGRHRPKSHLLRCFTEKWMGLVFSYVGRSVPAPLKSTGEGIIDLVKRLTLDPVPEVEDWRPFVRKFLAKGFSKLADPANLRTDPSGHAALGYSRLRGGHCSAVQDLVALGYFLKQGIHELDEFRPVSEQTDIGKFRVSRFLSSKVRGGTLFKKSDKMTGKKITVNVYKNRLAHSSVDHQDALQTACLWVLDQVDYIPVLPIEAGEKGMKTRFPTCSLTACNLIQQILRKSIDAILIQDARMAEGLGAPKRSQFCSETKFYSQDMSFATDMQPFWLTRTVYEELAKLDVRLQKYLPYYDKIFGPRRLVINITNPPCDISKIDYPFGEPVDIEAPMLLAEIRHAASDFDDLRKTVRGKVPLQHVKDACRYVHAFQKWLKDLSSPAVGPLTCRGAMMGDPTSFPVMPLMSAYAAHKAHHDSRDGMLTGDDAAYSGFGIEKIAPYETAMQSLGGFISVKKTEWNLKKAIFCETPYYEGRAQPCLFLSNWVAPPGGSKGEINWATQSLTVVQQNLTAGRPRTYGLWKYSPFWRFQQAAYLMGLPIGAPPEFGGVNHPKFPKFSVHWQSSWLGYLTTMPLAELVTGSGLGIFPSPYQDVRRMAADHVVSELFRMKDESILIREQIKEMERQTGERIEMEIPPNPVTYLAVTENGAINRTLDQVCDEAASPLIKSALYYRAPINPTKAPSIRRAVSKFRFKVRKSVPWKGSYLKVSREVRQRQMMYVGRTFRNQGLTDPVYGLERTRHLTRIRLEHWVDGRVAFR